MKTLGLISTATIAIVLSGVVISSKIGSAHLPIGDWPPITIDIAMQFIQERIDKFGLNPGEIGAATIITPLLSIN